jgi:hypothetical protein
VEGIPRIRNLFGTPLEHMYSGDVEMLSQDQGGYDVMGRAAVEVLSEMKNRKQMIVRYSLILHQSWLEFEVP